MNEMRSLLPDTNNISIMIVVLKKLRKSRLVKTVCLYVDNSNIFHEGQRYAEEYDHEDRYAFRIHFAHFLYLAKRGRKLDKVAMVQLSDLGKNLSKVQLKPGRRGEVTVSLLKRVTTNLS